MATPQAGTERAAAASPPTHAAARSVPACGSPRLSTIERSAGPKRSWAGAVRRRRWVGRLAAAVARAAARGVSGGLLHPARLWWRALLSPFAPSLGFERSIMSYSTSSRASARPTNVSARPKRGPRVTHVATWPSHSSCSFSYRRSRRRTYRRHFAHDGSAKQWNDSQTLRIHGVRLLLP